MTAVIFYSSDDCNIENDVAQTEGGCTEVSGSADQYKSFNVIVVSLVLLIRSEGTLLSTLPLLTRESVFARLLDMKPMRTVNF
jgi:hypothetical protein